MKSLHDQVEQYLRQYPDGASLRVRAAPPDEPMEPVDFSNEYQRIYGHEPECPACQGRGFVTIIHEDLDPGDPHRQELIPCPSPTCPVYARQQQERYSRLVAKAPLPEEYARLTFADWDALPKSAIAEKWDGLIAARLFVERCEIGYALALQEIYDRVSRGRVAPNDYVKNSLILAGRPGIGKTSLAACIVNELALLQIPALYIRVNNLLDALKEPFNHNDPDYMFEFGRTEQQILATFMRAPVLVLDEFNLARVSDYSKQRLEDIIRHRMSNTLPTVMTTNLESFEDFNDHWGLRVGHAVQGMAHWIVMDGVELRRRGQEVKSL